MLDKNMDKRLLESLMLYEEYNSLEEGYVKKPSFLKKDPTDIGVSEMIDVWNDWIRDEIKKIKETK